MTLPAESQGFFSIKMIEPFLYFHNHAGIIARRKGQLRIYVNPAKDIYHLDQRCKVHTYIERNIHLVKLLQGCHRSGDPISTSMGQLIRRSV